MRVIVTVSISLDVEALATRQGRFVSALRFRGTSLQTVNDRWRNGFLWCYRIFYRYIDHASVLSRLRGSVGARESRLRLFHVIHRARTCAWWTTRWLLKCSSRVTNGMKLSRQCLRATKLIVLLVFVRQTTRGLAESTERVGLYTEKSYLRLFCVICSVANLNYLLKSTLTSNLLK